MNFCYLDHTVDKIFTLPSCLIKIIPVQITNSHCRKVDLGLVAQIDAGDDWVSHVVFYDVHQVVNCHSRKEAKYGHPVEKPQFGTYPLRRQHFMVP